MGEGETRGIGVREGGMVEEEGMIGEIGSEKGIGKGIGDGRGENRNEFVVKEEEFRNSYRRELLSLFLRRFSSRRDYGAPIFALGPNSNEHCREL